MGIMRGWKTWTGAAVLVLTGVAKVVGAVQNFPDVNGADLKDGLEIVGAAIAIVGIGHKIDKSGIVNVPGK